MDTFSAFQDELEKLGKFKRPPKAMFDPHPWARRSSSKRLQALISGITGALTGAGGGALIGATGGPAGAALGAGIGGVGLGALGAGSGYGAAALDRFWHARGTLGRLRRGGHSLTKYDVKLLGEAAGMSPRQVRGAIKKMTTKAALKKQKTFPVSRFFTSKFDMPEARHMGESAERLYSAKALKSRSLTGRKLMKSEEKLLSELQKHKPSTIKKVLPALAAIPAAGAAVVGLNKLKNLFGTKKKAAAFISGLSVAVS